MSHKIIKPEGIELIEYLNNGYAICNRCGAVMRQAEDPKTGCGVYICPSCGLKVDEEDYEYESDEEVEWTEEMLDMLMDFIKNDPRGEQYRSLDWSKEYDLARNGDPNDTQTAL